MKLIKDDQSEITQKIFNVGYSCHLAHLCSQKGAKALLMQVDDFIIDLFYHFKRSTKRKATLRDYMEFTYTEVKEIIKHVSTLWFSLKSPLNRTLIQWDASESRFLSEFEDDDEKTKDGDIVKREIGLVRKFNDPFTKLYAFLCNQ